MFQFAICDDDKRDSEQLKELIEQYRKKKKLAYELQIYESGEQFLKSGCKPDVLFLDIMMNEKDGIQLGSEIKEQKPELPVIYTTNLREKISAAINRVHAFGYLEKPIQKENLYEVMDDVMKNLKRKDKEPVVTFLSADKTKIELSVSHIYYFEYVNRMIKIVTGERAYLCKEKIGNIAKQMEIYGFVMSHQSFVVNLYQVEKISDQFLIMKNGDRVCLAQKRASAVRKHLMQLAQKSKEGGR